MPMPMPMIEHERRIYNKQTKKWLAFLRFYLVYFSYEARFCSSTVNISQIAYVNGAWAGKQDLWKISFSFGSSHSSLASPSSSSHFSCVWIASHRIATFRVASHPCRTDTIFYLLLNALVRSFVHFACFLIVAHFSNNIQLAEQA